MKRQLICEICRQHIGYFYSEEIVEPITGAMFQSKDPAHGFPPPFRSPSLGWEDMTCPYCTRRPFSQKGLVLTEGGFWSIGKQEFVENIPRIGLMDRDDVNSVIGARGIAEERLRTHLQPERVPDIGHRLDPVKMNGINEQKPDEEVDRAAYNSQAGDQSSPEVIDPKQMTPEQRKEEAQRRIALEELEEEKANKFNYPCPIQGCPKGYVNESNLNRHLKKHHGIESSGGENGRNDNAEVRVAEGATSS